MSSMFFNRICNFAFCIKYQILKLTKTCESRIKDKY